MINSIRNFLFFSRKRYEHIRTSAVVFQRLRNIALLSGWSKSPSYGFLSVRFKWTIGGKVSPGFASTHYIPKADTEFQLPQANHCMGCRILIGGLHTSIGGSSECGLMWNHGRNLQLPQLSSASGKFVSQTDITYNN